MRGCKQSRADIELAQPGGLGRHLEPQLAIDDDKIDHAAVSERVFRFSDSQQRLPFCRCQDVGQAAIAGTPDKEHVQTGDRFVAPQLAHRHRPAIDGAADGQLGKFVRHGVGADDADDERAVGAGEASFRPVDIAAELEQVSRLDLALDRIRTFLPLRAARAEQHGKDQARQHQPAHGRRRARAGQSAGQFCHTSFTKMPGSTSLRVAAAPNSAWRGPRFWPVTDNSRSRRSFHPKRMSTAVYAGTEGLGSAATRRSVTSKSWFGEILKAERNCKLSPGSLPAALAPMGSVLPGLSESRSFNAVTPALRRQRGIAWYAPQASMPVVVPSISLPMIKTPEGSLSRLRRSS